MKTILSLLLSLSFLFPINATAGHHRTPFHGEMPQSKEDRQKWFQEVRELKHQFLAKELKLTKEQQNAFFPLYDRMEDENRKVNQEVRLMERRVYELKGEATDLDYQKATEAIYEVKAKEAEIDMKYKEEFSKILNSRQMFLLKGAERKFTRDLMDRHQKIKNK